MYFVFCQLNYTSRTSLCPLNIDVFLTFSYRYQQVVRKIAFLSFPQSDNAIFICFTGTICFFLPSFTAFLIAYFLLTKLFIYFDGCLFAFASFIYVGCIAWRFRYSFYAFILSFPESLPFIFIFTFSSYYTILTPLYPLLSLAKLTTTPTYVNICKMPLYYYFITISPITNILSFLSFNPTKIAN